jgi:hypothetical protein
MRNLTAAAVDGLQMQAAWIELCEAAAWKQAGAMWQGYGLSAAHVLVPQVSSLSIYCLAGCSSCGVWFALDWMWWCQ